MCWCCWCDDIVGDVVVLVVTMCVAAVGVVDDTAAVGRPLLLLSMLVLPRPFVVVVVLSGVLCDATCRLSCYRCLYSCIASVICIYVVV